LRSRKFGGFIEDGKRAGGLFITQNGKEGEGILGLLLLGIWEKSNKIMDLVSI